MSNKPKLNDDELPELSAKDVEEVLKKAAEARRLRQEQKQPKDERTGTCVVCRGKVVARVTRSYLGDPRNMIIGPGYSNQLTTVHHGFHCTTCGLKYEFLTGEEKNENI